MQKFKGSHYLHKNVLLSYHIITMAFVLPNFLCTSSCFTIECSRDSSFLGVALYVRATHGHPIV